MRVLLLQLDGSLPNLALMQVSAHHRALGHEVTLQHVTGPKSVDRIASVERGLWDAWDHIYASLIFEKTRPLAERLRQVFPSAQIGGTGWDVQRTLADVGIPETAPDYSIYPAFAASIGFTQRGCRLKCSFCVVPRKEGGARATSSICGIWRGPPHPKHVILLDNDFFGQEQWAERIAEIREGGYRVNFNQGINARFLTDETAEAIASVDYYDADFRKRRLYTAWDNLKDEARLFAGLDCLKRAGVRPGRITVYLLIGYWPGETEEDWLYRVGKLRDYGCDPYPMPFVRTPLTVGFQRWCVGHYFRKVPWPDWKAASCQPKKLGPKAKAGRLPLPLFSALEEEER